MQHVAVGIASFVVIASVWGWARALRRLRAGRSILPLEPRRPVPWGLVDLAATLFAYFAFHGIGFFILRQKLGVDLSLDLVEMSPQDRAAVVVSGTLASLAAVIVSLAAIVVRARAGWHDIGVRARHVIPDLRLGLFAFVMLAPPVYAVQLALVQWFPSRHPLILMLKENPDPVFLMITGLSAVAVAPLSEEYFFRLLLQGWLEKVAVVRGGLRGLLSADWAAEETGQEVYVVEPQDNPYAPPSVGGTTEVELSDVNSIPRDQEEMSIRSWPILVSGVLFALMHASHGPDPIPLFLLALGLGYLYQRTHRILPSITVHLLLNACSLAALMMEISKP